MSQDAYAPPASASATPTRRSRRWSHTWRRSTPASPRASCRCPATTRACCGSTSAPGIAFGTDGVGTKMVVAEQLGRFDTIGIDCIAMNVNDLICVGAEPIAMLDFILCREADAEVCGADRRGAARRRRAGRDRDPGRRDRPGRRRRLGLGAGRLGDRPRRARRDRHRRADRARRRADRPPLLRPPLERLHARAQGARRRAAGRRAPRPPARRRAARADDDLRPRGARAARLRRRRPRPRPHHRRRPQQPAAALARRSATRSPTRSTCRRSSA